MLPNVLLTALVVIALTGSRIILLEASLSLLGLGDPTVMSWGYLVSNAQRFLKGWRDGCQFSPDWPSLSPSWASPS